MNRAFVFLVACFVLISCDEEYQPLPVGQLRIALPDHEYVAINGGCPYSMEIPIYSRILPKSAPDGNCWSNLNMPALRAIIHLTYRRLDGDLARTLDETYDLTYSHVSMADNIEDEQVLYPDQDVYGTVYTISGNVASNIQFYVTDSTKHFLRGALYFNTAPNKDSLAPVVDHIRQDIDHMLESLKWID